MVRIFGPPKNTLLHVVCYASIRVQTKLLEMRKTLSISAAQNDSQFMKDGFQFDFLFPCYMLKSRHFAWE
jgi:hypothetical protein